MRHSGHGGLVLVLAAMASCLSAVAAGETAAYVSQQAAADRFPLVGAGGAVPVWVEAQDHEVVQIAARDLTLDIERVTGQRPRLTHPPKGDGSKSDGELAVIVGSIDRSRTIAALMKAGKLDLAKLEGRWEAFTLQLVDEPLPGLKQALVIVGSDRRGTAYGVYELSRRIGVSPWYWWADVTPVKREALHVSKESVVVGPPAVKYRGIFINDEMWGIRPWAEGTFAPEEGKGIGPRTHAKIFELLLRLRANYLWPAMHQGTEPFHVYPGNKVVADRYAMVMGASHIEPMQRNNIEGAEWDREDGGEWNYATNRDSIYAYWERGVKKCGPYENVYTIGMRGQDDEAMKGGATRAEKIALLERIVADQREILAKHVHPDPAKVPQVFIPYTEVLQLYDAGMKVPEDVIICWPDDNFGFIRRLPTAREQARAGGSGVYYHIQWINGATSAYAWLNTMPPSLIFSEMNKAWQHGVEQIWVLNVGDIKPGEIGTEYFLDMAWDPARRTHDNSRDFLVEWARRDLDPRFGEEIADIMEEYYQLGFTRRPEFLVQHQQGRPLRYSWFSHDHEGDEAGRRLARYQRIVERAEWIYERIPDARKAAFFQLVLYPVKCSALMNQKVIHADKSMVDGKFGRSSARVHALKARRALEEIIAWTDRYNNDMPGGVGAKWRHMMHWAPGPWGAQRHQYEMPPLSDYNGLGKPALQLSAEGGGSGQIADFSVFTQRRRFIDLHNTGKGCIQWRAEPEVAWLKLDQSAGSLTTSQRIWLEVDWEQAPQGAEDGMLHADVKFTSNAGEATLRVPVFHPSSPLREAVVGYVESHGCVSMEAEHATRQRQGRGESWQQVHNLGRSGDAMLIHPVTGDSHTTAESIRHNSPVLEFDMHLFSHGDFVLHLDCLPTQALSPGRGVRLAVSLDDGEPRIIGIGAGDSSSYDKLANLRRWTTSLKVDQPGAHTLKLWMVDPGVILDKLVLNTGGLKPSYLGPLESFRR